MLRLVGLCCALAFVASSASVSFAAPTRRIASGEVIRAWNEIAVAQPFDNSVRLSRVLAMVHAAQHDAVNGVEPRYARYISRFSDPNADPEAAAASAAHTVLAHLFPENRANLDAELERSLTSIPDGTSKELGVRLGSAVGANVVDYRVNDGFSVPDTFNPPPGPGVWQPTPPDFMPMVEPQFRNVRLFALAERTRFMPESQPPLSSAEYARDFEEVKLLGQNTSSARTEDQTHTAHFWVEPSPAGWSRMGSLVAAQQGYDLHTTARLLALLNMAMADGFIIGWHQKTHFAFWRPVTAIHQADADGNPATQADTSWLPLRPTPPAPDYPSTHSLLGGAAAEILRQFTGTDAVDLCMASATSTPPGSTRCWHSFTEAELENAESRVLVGFHFRFATVTGIDVGRKVGSFAMSNALVPLAAE